MIFRGAAACSLFIALGLAQPKFEFWPGTAYDPAVPTFEKVLSYSPGDRISSHANIMKYFESLSAAAPRRMQLTEYAKSWEGRKLVYAAIGSEANLRRLPEIKAAMKQLSDPRKTSAADAKRIMQNLPAILFLSYGVHGNEISSCDSAMLTAYHLLAAQNDKIVTEILASTIILIDPTQNPDGRDRFVHSFEQAEGLEADAFPLAAEHNEPWPGGRTNHYFFDMNRDWFALTQPETRGRIKVLRDWRPVVFVDLHEMGSEGSYYFAPEAIPFNPHLTREQKTSLDWFGKNNAKYFDQYGFSYFTREVYDAFYPGYGASWPSYYGAIAMTYENASSRGLKWRRSDDRVFTYRDTVLRHFVSSVSTAQASAQHRTELLDNFYRYQQTAIEEGTKDSIREYILPRRGDVGAVDRLARLLFDQGVEIRQATAAFATYPVGSYLISLAQPSKRLIRVLLDKDVPLEPEFLKEQERRRQKKLPDEIYDVTAWSLPLLKNLECIESQAPITAASEPYTGAEPTRPALVKATVAYLVPWGSQAAAKFLTTGLKAGLRIHSTDKAFTQSGRKFPGGTLIVKVKENEANLHALMEQARGTAEIVSTDSGWVEDGVNFGSRFVRLMNKPTVAIAWDRPVGASSAGHARFVLERQFNYPVTPIRTAVIGQADLSKIDVLILPDQGFGGAEGYATILGPGGIKRLKDWVAAGGTIVAIGGAVTALSDARIGLLATSQESLAKEGEKKVDAPKPETSGRIPGKLLKTEEDYLKSIQPENETPDAVQGILAKAKVDPDHWLTVGVPETVFALVDGRGIFTPLKLDKGTNAAVFAAADQLLASGYIWEENRKQLAFKPLVMTTREGRGNIIAFTSDPNYRAYMDGMNLLFLNAVFRGAAHSR